MAVWTPRPSHLPTYAFEGNHADHHDNAVIFSSPISSHKHAVEINIDGNLVRLHSNQIWCEMQSFRWAQFYENSHTLLPTMIGEPIKLLRSFKLELAAKTRTT